MSKEAATASTGVSGNLCGILFIVFLVLKLTHTIDWSWWWVTAPLWIPTAFVAGILALIGVFYGIAKLVK